LQVNKLKYGRRDFQKKEQIPWKRPVATWKEWNKKAQNKVVGAAKAKSENASFAQMVKGGGVRASQEDVVLGPDTPSFSVKEEVPIWLEHSFVRSLTKASDIKVMKESFFMGGFNFVRLRYLGSKYVLLSSDVEGFVERLMEENKEWLVDIFDSIVSLLRERINSCGFDVEEFL